MRATCCPALAHAAAAEVARALRCSADGAEYVEALLDRHDRNVSAAAEAAGVDRTYLYRLVRKYRI